MKKKPIAEHTDRELLEKSVLYQKITSENTTFLKTALIVYSILTVLGAFILVSELG